jgi:hypothetical protein
MNEPLFKRIPRVGEFGGSMTTIAKIRSAVVRNVTWVGLVVAVLLLAALPVGQALPTQAAPSPRSATSAAGAPNAPIGWAYGRVVEFQYSSDASLHHGLALRGKVLEGYSVILNQTNTSTGYLLQVTRTTGVSVNLTFCPGATCTNPLANFTLRAWERSVSFGNFTENGTVLDTVTLQTVPAVALANSTGTYAGNLTERFALLRGGIPIVRLLAAHVAGNLSAEFSPAIGLYPLNLSATSSWVSTAAYSATGSWAGDFAAQTLVNGSTVFQDAQNISGALNRTGILTISGAVIGSPIQVAGHGAERILVRPGLLSPFEVGDGFILLPREANLLGAIEKPWGVFAPGSAWARLNLLEVAPPTTRGAHLGFLGSAWIYNLNATNPADSRTMAASSGGPNSTAPSSSLNVSQNQVQSQPESVPQAEQSSTCLQKGACSSAVIEPALGSSGSSGIFGTPLLLLSGSLVAGAALVLLVVARRRPPRSLSSRPTPGYQPARPANPPRPVPEPESAVDDPLRELW